MTILSYTNGHSILCLPRCQIVSLAVAVLALTFCSIAKALPDINSSYSSLWLAIDGVAYEVSLSENSYLTEHRVLQGELQSSSKDSALHFKGQVLGFTDSAVRMSYSQGYWRGLVILNNLLYRVDHRLGQQSNSYNPLPASRVELPTEEQQLCGSPHHTGKQILSNASVLQLPSESSSLDTTEFEPPVISFSVAGAADCPDPVDGVCLLPELEIVYDLSYQAINSFGETVLDRATRELNELDLFFERSFDYRFSRVTMTFLNQTQDAQFSSHDSAAGLLNALRTARARAELPFVQSSRSILHFMTGRNFPRDDEGRNVVGIAFLDVFCETFGLNTGLTDAGDAFLVSLVMAHEIGHNLGADHDEVTENGCSANTHVMTASIGPGAFSISDFSSCSIAAIQPNIVSTISRGIWPQCIDFPVDFGVTEDSGNISVPPRGESFTSNFLIDRQSGNVGATRLQIEGMISDATNGQWDSVSITGGNCAIPDNTFSCIVNSASESLNLRVAATIDQNADLFDYVLSVSTVGGQTKDVVLDNNTVAISFTSFAPSDEDSEGPTIDDGSSSGSSGSASSGGSSSGGSSSGGGGGAVQLPYLIAFIVMCLLRTTVRVRRRS